jgi:AcrR family transcriptional regulator
MPPTSRNDPASVPRLGLRERNKLDKLRRIKDAARDLFVSRGFDDTTTREIARLADVGLGTLFSYASDKRDLLFLIINDDLAAMTQVAADEFASDQSVEKKLRSLWRHHYAFFSQQPRLSRLVLREQQFYEDTQQAMRFQATRTRLMGLITGVIRQGVGSGEFNASVEPEFVSRIIFGIYQMELREWLAHEPLDIKHGIAALERSLSLVIGPLRADAARRPALVPTRTGAHAARASTVAAMKRRR